MRISAAHNDGRFYRAYDYPAGVIRRDLCWVDDVLNQVAVGRACLYPSGEYCEIVDRIEQRKRVLIITALRWIALDLPEDAEPECQVIEGAVDYQVPEVVVVR